jgi:hypothetical protein
MPKMAGLLEEMYSWHMDPFFQPKKSTNCSVEDPASAALVAAVLLIRKNLLLHIATGDNQTI